MIFSGPRSTQRRKQEARRRNKKLLLRADAQHTRTTCRVIELLAAQEVAGWDDDVLKPLGLRTRKGASKFDRPHVSNGARCAFVVRHAKHALQNLQESLPRHAPIVAEGTKAPKILAQVHDGALSPSLDPLLSAQE